jgi:2-polyprenyl-3-methyl-5-hydroxy-6-metoxy-1,4-benzoquinol methylase
MDRDRSRALADRLFESELRTLELFTMYLGERLGLYRALGEGGPADSTQLSECTGTNERYIREWLEQQAASGLLEVENASANPLARRYSLAPEHAAVLADPDDLEFGAYRSIDVARHARTLPALVEAFRTGGAPPRLSWEPEGRAEFNRALFLNRVGKEWLPAIADVDRRLRAEPPARVADMACGTGWSSIAMAQAYPRIAVDGFDVDEESIAAARRNARDSGVTDRVAFSVSDAAAMGGAGRYDLVTIFEALHDMSRPVDALRSARRALRAGGSALVADERVEDEFTAPAPLLERHAYAWSVISCLPGAMGDPQTAATGAVMRPATLRGYAAAAGFSDTHVLPIETGPFRFYRLIP